jgi:exopolysaccharide production protein ExoZ
LVYPWLVESLSGFVFNTLNIRFLAGVGVALIVQRWKIPSPRLVAAAGVVVFLCTGMFDSFAGPLGPWTQCAGYTLGSALTMAGLVQAERSGLLQPPRWLVYLGNASYSIYLVHFLGLSVLAKLTMAARLDLYVPLVILFCAHVVGAIAIGCAFHHLVEHPIHVWAKGRFRRAKTQTAVVTELEIRKAA